MPVNAVDSATASNTDQNGVGSSDHGAWKAAAAPPPPPPVSQPPPVKAGDDANSRPTSLLDDTGNANNCLDHASVAAKDGRDDIVFLNNNSPGANGVGHVVVENVQTGQVTDPEALGGARTSADMASYLGQAGSQGYQFSVAATAPAADVHRVLSLPPDQRAAAIAQSDPSLEGIENEHFADVGTSVTAAGGDQVSYIGSGASFPAGEAPTVTVSGTGGGGTPISVGVSGGVWTSANAQTLQSLDAAPQVAPGSLADSAADAEKLAAGTTVQDLLSSGQSTEAINGAYELLGISNRQISLYAGAAAQGGVGKDQQIFGILQWTPTGTTAFNALKSAAQMRVGSSSTGAQDVEAGGQAPAIFSPEPGVVPLPPPRAGSLPGDLGFQGMYNAVDQGVTNANVYSYPSFVADGMLYGSGGIYINKAIPANQSAFGGQDAGSAQSAVAKGQSLLSSSAVTQGGALSSSLISPTAISTLSTLSTTTPAAWTPQTATAAFYAADDVMQAIIPTVNRELQAEQSQVGASANTDSAAQAASLQRGVIDKALASNGVTGLTAADIGDMLVSAASSPAFTQATGGSQQSANTAYTIMSTFDPQSLQHLALVEKYGMPDSGVPLTAAQTQNRKLLAPYLNTMSTTPFPNSSTPPTQQDMVTAGLTAGAWTTASLRWFLDGAQKLGTVAATNGLQRAQTFSNFLTTAVQNAQVSVSITPSGTDTVSSSLLLRYPTDPGQSVTSYTALTLWAADKAGLGTAAVTNYLENAGAGIANLLNTYGAGPLAAAQLGIRGGQIGSANNTADKVTNSLYAFADAASLASWAANPSTVGSSLVKGVANVGDNLNGLAAWAGLADAAPPIAIDPNSQLAQFFNGVFTHGGTAALLTYGGLNTGLGLKTIAGGQVTQGVLQTAAGLLDFGQGLVQVLNAANPDLAPTWTNINAYGFSLPAATLIAARFAAGSIGAAQAGISFAGLGG